MAYTLTGGFGLRPIGKVGGNVNNNATTMYEIANNYTTAIYYGGIVVPACTKHTPVSYTHLTLPTIYSV